MNFSFWHIPAATAARSLGSLSFARHCGHICNDKDFLLDLARRDVASIFDYDLIDLSIYIFREDHTQVLLDNNSKLQDTIYRRLFSPKLGRAVCTIIICT